MSLESQAPSLDAKLVEGFVEVYLRAKYDNPLPIPDFHRVIWDLACSDARKVAVACPRGFGKSSAVTHAYVLACLLFGFRNHCIIVSDTEGQAVSFLNDIKVELKENDDLREAFGIVKFLRDTETDIVVLSSVVGKFRVVAKGAEQKVRGLKWRGKRPNLIVIDDLENDEMVMNPERRAKVMNWVMNALLPCGSDDCIIRMVGTILHLDSVLERILKDRTWRTVRYKAHNEDFSQLLWPEKFPRERLMEIRSGYAQQNNLAGYSQEYLNFPIDEHSSFYRKDMFADMTDRDRRAHESRKFTYYAAMDVAVSTKQTADFTVIVVGGMDQDGRLHIVDCRWGRWDSLEIINQMFKVHGDYEPDLFAIEQGAIEKSIGPFLNAEMVKRGKYLNLMSKFPSKDKKTRANGMNAMMRAGGVRFDFLADWFGDLQEEMCRFPRARYDDKVDAMSLLGLIVEQIIPGKTDEQIEEDDLEELWARSGNADAGRSVICGY